MSEGPASVEEQTRPVFDDLDAEGELDAVTRRVIDGKLHAVCDEMGHTLARTSYSNTIRESEDFGCALLDSTGRQLCETDSTPLQMGPIPAYVRGVIDLFAERGDGFEPGDVVVHNDPYHGASHAPDLGVVLPVFYDGSLAGFSVTTAHHVDVGANEPGTCIVDTIDAYSESIRLNALRLERGGERNEGVWQLIADNVRVPEMVLGDLEAQLSAARLGADRLRALFDEHGHRTVMAAGEGMMDYAERRLRRRIEAVPDGTYSADGAVDGYPQSGDPREVDVPLAVDLTVEGSDLRVDLSRCADQLDNRPINMPFEGTVVPAVLLTIRSTLLDTATTEPVPQNEGIRRPVTIHAPEGSIVNPRFPAPTIARFSPGNRIADLTLRALAEAVPGSACAGTGNTKTVTVSGTDEGEYWMHMDIGAAAYGGRPGSDGMDAVDTLFANTRNVAIEDIEAHYPLRVTRYELREAGAGAGRFRGGYGPVREVELRADAGLLSIEADGHRQPPWGYGEGQEGATGAIELRRDGDGEVVDLPPNLDNRRVEHGDRIRTVAPCGGGWEDPLERDPRAVCDDVRDDLLTVEAARETYGVVLDGDGEVDREATRETRSRRRDE